MGKEGAGPSWETESGRIIFIANLVNVFMRLIFTFARDRTQADCQICQSLRRGGDKLPPACPTFSLRGQTWAEEAVTLLHSCPEDTETWATGRAGEDDSAHSLSMKRKSKANSVRGSWGKHTPDFPGLQRWNQGSWEWFRRRGTNKLTA